MNGEYAALADRIEQKLDDIERVAGRAERLLNQAQVNDDDGYLDGVALNLHGYYAGVESIFEDIARNIDDSIPQGPDWRRALPATDEWYDAWGPPKSNPLRDARLS